jgi:hypothetical protein
LHFAEQQCARKWLRTSVRRMLESIGVILEMPKVWRDHCGNQQ